MRLASGATLAGGRYRLQRRLGAGGMASVWLGEDTRLGRPVAVKVIADALADDEGWLARFEREARAAAALSHPNIVQVFDYGIEEGRPYLVMEYIAGTNLSERLGDAALPPTELEAFAGQLLDAVAHVHEAGIVHRDIKPANIMLDPQGRAHLTDFGIAHAGEATSLTQTGMVVGTLKYLAPEVAAGQPAGPASDLYSAGMVLREVAGPSPPPTMAALSSALTHPDPEQRIDSAAAALARLAEKSPTAAITAATRAMTTPEARRPSPPSMTRVLPSDTPGPPTSGWRSPGAPAARRFVPHAVVGLIVLVVIVLIVLLGGGSDPTPGPDAAVAPARPAASLSEQLRALDRIVDHAGRR